MVKPRLNLTVAQLVAVSLGGFVIAIAALPLSRIIHTADACDCIRWTPFLLLSGTAVLGIIVSVVASTSLKNGIKNQQWPEEQIHPLRSWLESPLMNGLLLALFVAYAVLWLIHSRYRTLGFVGFVFIQVIGQLKNAVRRPSAKPSNLITGWRDLSPIHSDQWGQR